MPTPTAEPPSQATIDAPAAAEKAPADFMADAMGDFEAMASGKPEPSRETPRDDKGKFKPADKPAKSKPADETKAPGSETKPEETEAKPTGDETKPAETEPKRTTMRELGQRYDDLKKRVESEYKPEIQKLKARLAEIEEHPSEEAAAPLLAKVKALEARNGELERHIAFVDFSQSDKFNKEYRQPYVQAWNEAVTEFRELTVRLQDGVDDVGEPKFTTRPADENDLLKLANMKLSEMDDAAQQMFGASASRAIGHVQTLRRLSAAQHKALEEARTKAKETMAQQTAEMSTRNKVLAQTWQDINQSLHQRYPKAFLPEEGNESDKSSHTKGFALADLLFLGENALSPEQVEALPSGFRETVKAKKPLSETQRVQLHALARLKMANHDRKVSALKAAQERIAELEKSLAEYEKSEPSAERAGKAAPAVEGKDWLETAEADFKAMDR